MQMRYHELVGKEVVDPRGKRLGRVHDLAAEQQGSELRVTGLYVGPAALLRRIGAHRDSILEEKPSEQIPWEFIARIDNVIRLRIHYEDLRQVAPGVEEPERAVRPGGEP